MKTTNETKKMHINIYEHIGSHGTAAQLNILQTSFLHVSLVISRSESGSFICQQGHQSLSDHEVRRGDEFVLLGYTSQEAGQEFPLDGVVDCGQIHASSCRDQVLERKTHRFNVSCSLTGNRSENRL